MPPTPLDCTKVGCEWKTPSNCPDWDKMVKLLELHTIAEHGTSSPIPEGNFSSAQRLEKLPRPTFQLEMTQAEWAFKTSQWHAYISQSVVSESTKVQQLRAACDDDLLRRVYDAGDLSSLTTETLLLAQIKKIAVRVVHKTLHLQNLWAMHQSPEESIRAYASRLVGTAELCELFVTCSKATCNQKTSYRDEVVVQALLRGMHDKDIRTRVLSRTQNDELKGLSAIVDYIAAEEASSASFSTLSLANTMAGTKSSYKQQQNKRPETDSGLHLVKCKHCGGKHEGNESRTSRQQYCKAFDKKCTKCGKMHHFANVCRSSAPTAAAVTDGSVTGGLISSANFYAMQTTCPTTFEQLRPFVGYLSQEGPVTTIPLPHLVHSQVTGWVSQPALPSPTVSVDIRIDKPAYTSLKIPVPKSSLRTTKARNVCSCADTGAQLTTIPVSLLSSLGVQASDVFPIATNLNTVTGAPVDLIGGLLVEFCGVNPVTGVKCTSRQLAYVSSTIPYPFLSREACVDLGLVPSNFPTIGGCGPSTMLANTSCSNSGVTGPDDMPCSCPLRQLPPEDPPTLPCEPTEDNLEILHQYILDRYSASAFNMCERQPLPLMKTSPPLRLFMDKETTPVAVHSPASVPLHWQAAVKAGLERDIRLGVIERVPVNTPTTWCSRMIITPKHDGSPRRVVDFQAVNNHCPRQTHHTESPWQIASAVPPNCVKTVLDAWHGYHSVPIHPRDRHVTTFITTEGRFQYRTAPQGLLSAGDGYTQRFDDIIRGFPNHSKCVDDSILWADDIRSNFFSTCAFLDKCSAAGIIFNREKFQFARTEVDYLGFRITQQGLKPTEEFVKNISSFPVPKSITDVRSWFGCVQQISYTFAVSEVMLPFRQLLRPQVPFNWNDELDQAFKASKQEIIRQCEKGVRLYDMSATTGLATDWSKNCMGWWLVQKHCSCPDPPVLGCCKTGWQTVFCGSKFNSQSESRYAPIEGEAAAVLLGLEKCSHFILGLPNLLLAIDHKPLVAIFGSTGLENIPNPRLFRLKHKSLRYRFTPCHVPGKKNVVPDTMSRRNDATQSPSLDTPISSEYSSEMGPPDWVSSPKGASCSAMLSNSTEVCDTEEFLTGVAMSKLQSFNSPPENVIANVIAPSLQAVTWEMLQTACESCPDYRLLHDFILQGLPEDSKDWDQKLLPYYRHRHLLTTLGPVILVNERPLVPKSLRTRVVEHVHSGHPGLSTMCQRLSSSLYWPNYREDLTRAKISCGTCRQIAPSNPAMPPRPPVAPQYPFQSVVCDFFVVAGQSYAALADRYSNWLSVLKLKQDTSAELVTTLRGYFSTFGIPEVFSSDGATIFTSSLFSDFCNRWGIQQRISSAYHPRSNKRAELAVKHAKRLVQDCLGRGGSLDTDRMARALLAHRNTPDSLTGVSPAQVVFGRVLRDFLPASPGRYVPRPEWRLNSEQREIAHARRHIKTEEVLASKSRLLQSLQLGDLVSVQDQTGNTPRRWSKTGTVIDVLGNDAYLVRIDGSRKVTKRNRQYLRRLIPYKCDVDEFAPSVLPSTDQSMQSVDAPDPVEDLLCPSSVPSDVSQSLPTTPVVSPPDDSELPTTNLHITSPDPTVIPLEGSALDPSLEPNMLPKSMHAPDAPIKNRLLKRPSVRETWIVNPKFCQSDDKSSTD